MSGSGQIRLRRPLRQADEKFKILAPRWLSAGLPTEGPWIRTLFDDDFVNTFFAGVRASVDAAGQPQWNSSAWPQLRAWRDYAEPPAAMLKANGEPNYPKSVERRASLAKEADHDNLKDVEGAKPQAPWLRKLYLPLHQHFHFACCEVVCDQKDHPYVDASRIEAVRAVVRRLRPGTKDEVWDDWLPGAAGRGAWVHLANKIEDLTDPEHLPDAALQSPAELRKNLGLAKTDHLRLDSISLAALPQELGPAAKRQGRYGYLPVWSREKVIPLPQGQLSAEQIFNAGVSEETLRQFRGGIADAVGKLAKVAFRIQAGIPASNEPLSIGAVKALQDEASKSVKADWFTAVCTGNNPSLDELHGQMVGVLSNDFTTDERHTRLICTLLIHTAACRKAILDGWAAELQVLVPEEAPHGWTPSKDSTVHSLGEQIEAIQAWEEVRSKPRAPWGPPPWKKLAKAEGHVLQVHEAALALESVCLRFDEAMTREFGAAWRKAGDTLAANIQKGHLLGLSVTGDLVARLLFYAPGYAATLHDLRTGLQPLIQAELPTSAVSNTVTALRYDADSIYAVWVYARITHPDPCVKPSHVWSVRSEPFQIADPTDLLGQRPVAFSMPDLKKLKRDIPRMFKAGVMPFAAVTAPENSGFTSPSDPAKVKPTLTVGMIWSFGIPVFTICAMILFSIILTILLLIPGFAWLLTLKFCVPVAKKA